MKLRFFSLISLLLAAFCFSGCGHTGYAGPEKAVRQELDLIHEPDQDTVNTFFQSELFSAEDTKLISEVAGLLFKDFQYEILSSRQSSDGTSANVKVSITNINAKQLARDLCLEAYQQMYLADPSEKAADEAVDYFTLMKKCLTQNSYPTDKYTVTFQVNNADGLWYIDDSSDLGDMITGGLLTYLQDPSLLTPEEILDITLSRFEAFTAQDWISYLDIQNLFSVSEAAGASIDQELAKQIVSSFAYTIKDQKQENGKTYLTALITGPDLSGVMETCRSRLLSYAASTESIRATDEEVDTFISDTLLTVIKENTATSDTPVSIEMSQSEYTWHPILDSSFTDAILGDLKDSVALLNPAK